MQRKLDQEDLLLFRRIFLATDGAVYWYRLSYFPELGVKFEVIPLRFGAFEIRQPSSSCTETRETSSNPCKYMLSEVKSAVSRASTLRNMQNVFHSYCLVHVRIQKMLAAHWQLICTS